MEPAQWYGKAGTGLQISAIMQSKDLLCLACPGESRCSPCSQSPELQPPLPTVSQLPLQAHTADPIHPLVHALPRLSQHGCLLAHLEMWLLLSSQLQHLHFYPLHYQQAPIKPFLLACLYPVLPSSVHITGVVLPPSCLRPAPTHHPVH